jgi:hypothetical protein
MDQNQPLGLPQGSIRAIIAIILLVTVCVAVFCHVTLPVELNNLALVAVSYYVGYRVR